MVEKSLLRLVAAAVAAALLASAARADSIMWGTTTINMEFVTVGSIDDGSGEVIGIDRDSAMRTHDTAYVIPSEDEWYKAAAARDRFLNRQRSG